jgi:hypothetical protein
LRLQNFVDSKLVRVLDRKPGAYRELMKLCMFFVNMLVVPEVYSQIDAIFLEPVLFGAIRARWS